MLRGVVDWGRLRLRSPVRRSREPALAVRAAREAVKVERAGGLAASGARHRPRAGESRHAGRARRPQDRREAARHVAPRRLAEKEGGKTRAILKVAGRGAIGLTFAAFDLAIWILGALFTLFGFVSSLKSTTERITWRILQRRKRRRARLVAAMAHRLNRLDAEAPLDRFRL